MQVYIGYKFRRNKNKASLKEILENISQILEEQKHTTFILGRDIQKWDKHSISTLDNLKTIIKNLKQSDCVVAYIDTDDLSLGLSLEYFTAKLLGKKVVTLVRENVNAAFFLKKSDVVIQFKNLEDLKQKIFSENILKSN